MRKEIRECFKELPFEVAELMARERSLRESKAPNIEHQPLLITYPAQGSVLLLRSNQGLSMFCLLIMVPMVKIQTSFYLNSMWFVVV